MRPAKNMIIRRVDNGWVIGPAKVHQPPLEEGMSVAVTVEHLLEQVRKWAEPQVRLNRVVPTVPAAASARTQGMQDDEDEEDEFDPA